MANENKEIGEIVKKCKILLLDIEGTTTSISFVKDKLFPYAEENLKGYLESQWETKDTKEAVAALRKLNLEDQEKSVEGAVPIPGEDASKEDQIEGLVNNVKWQMSSDRKEGALKLMQGLVWKLGYDSGDIKGHVYDDVSAALEQWRSVEGQKIYIYSSGSVEAQKLLFGQSLAGDLLQYIDGHFDTAVGHKQEPSSYANIVEKIGVNPEEILFLTDIVKEAEAARSAGLHVALVSREGNAPLPSEATDAFAVLHSLAQLTVTNKRKNDPQDEQPAKVPKTDTDNDVKSSSEPVVSDDTAAVKEAQNEEEKMEVEETTAVEEPAQEKIVDEAETIETVIEDITDSVEPVDVPMIDVEPVITEADVEKPSTETKTETMEADETESVKINEDTKPNEARNGTESVTNSDQSVINPDEVTKEEVVSKPAEVETKLVEVETKPEEATTKPGEDVNKPDDNLMLADVSPPIEPKETAVEDKSTENGSGMDVEIERVESANEPEKEKIEAQVLKEKPNVPEETPPAVITAIEEITADNIGDVAEMIEDLEPVVEEPTNEEIEDLQNVGEVLEKECDEILSKVQDVTNLDNIPLKPMLNTIAEETMETEIDAENTDSNDIVDRILKTEFELEQCKDIDLNTVSDISSDVKTDKGTDSTDDKKSEATTTNTEEKNTVIDDVSSTPQIADTEISQQEVKTEDKINNEDKMETEEKVQLNDKTENNKVSKNNLEVNNVEIKENNAVEVKVDNQKNAESINVESNEIEKAKDIDKMETVDKAEEVQVEKVDEIKESPIHGDGKSESNPETKATDTDMVTEEAKKDVDNDKETQVNGKTTNGNSETVNLNGDASKAEELNSRLSVENGKEVLNGSNGDSNATEKAQGDKMDAEVSDIKVKTVATEEPRNDPIEQPTEA